MSQYYSNDEDEQDPEPDLYNLPTRKTDWSMFYPSGGGGGVQDMTTFYAQGLGRYPVETVPTQQPTSLTPTNLSGGGTYQYPIGNSQLGMDPRGGGPSLTMPFTPSTPSTPDSPITGPIQPGSTNPPAIGGSSVTNNTYNSSNSVGLAPGSFSAGLPQNQPFNWHDIEIPRSGDGASDEHLAGIGGNEAKPPQQTPTTPPLANPQQQPKTGSGGLARLAVDVAGGGQTAPPAGQAPPQTKAAAPAKTPTRADTALGVASIFSPLARKVEGYRSKIEQAKGRVSGDNKKRTDAAGNPLVDWSQY
jgi:hypothetical protein